MTLRRGDIHWIEFPATTGLHGPSVVLAFQLRAIDRNRVQERLGYLSPQDLTALDTRLRSLLSL